MSTQQWSFAPHRYIIVGASIFFSIFILAVDMKAGPFIRIPVLLVLPVIAVSWYGGLVMGEVLAIGLPIMHLAVEWNISKPWSSEDSVINAVIRIITFSLISFLVYYVNRQRTRLKVLQGLLPICSFCKKIRTKEEKWEQMESYITHHSQAEFSHGVCPECAQKHYGAIMKKHRGPDSSSESKTSAE
jgi:hypothetical protein